MTWRDRRREADRNRPARRGKPWRAFLTPDMQQKATRQAAMMSPRRVPLVTPRGGLLLAGYVR